MSMRVKSIHSPYVNEHLRLIVEGQREPLVTLEFVDEDGIPYAEELPYSKIVRVKATFDEAPEEATQDIRLSWEGSTQSVDWIEVKRSLFGRKVYLSEPFLLEQVATLPNSEATIGEGGKLKL